MKTTTYILTLILTINGYFLEAAISNPVLKSPSAKSDFSINFINLAPTTPAVAGFNDSEPVRERNYDVLRPMTPKEASFDEQVTIEITNSIENLLRSLSPVTPVNADFNETSNKDSIEILKPITPRNAGFDDIR